VRPLLYELPLLARKLGLISLLLAILGDEIVSEQHPASRSGTELGSGPRPNLLATLRVQVRIFRHEDIQIAFLGNNSRIDEWRRCVSNMSASYRPCPASEIANLDMENHTTVDLLVAYRSTLVVFKELVGWHDMSFFTFCGLSPEVRRHTSVPLRLSSERGWSETDEAPSQAQPCSRPHRCRQYW
jgi:hypothetical protein